MALMGDFKLGKVLDTPSALPSHMGLVPPLLSGLHIQRNYLWEIILPTVGIFPGITLAPLCQSVSFGDYSIDTNLDVTRFGAYTAKYPGLFERIDDVKLTFLKIVPDAVTTYFTLWRKLIVGPTGLYSAKSQYAKTFYVIFLDSTGIPVNRYKFTGAFPKTMPKYQLGYEAKITEVTVDLSVDYIETLY